MTKDKLALLKEALANPPPERLARIEYRSHFFQMIGICGVCIMLVLKGFWYIIFALIFGVGVSYSQGMNAYRRYKTIMGMRAPEAPKDFEADISYTRRRGKIIEYTLGKKTYWLSLITAAIIPMFMLSWFDPVGVLQRIGYSLMYFTFLITIFIIIYYRLCFFIANIVYQRDKRKGFLT